MGEDHEEPVESPPDGATCGAHPDRPAMAVCPRCGSFTCLACWHGPVRRCHECLRRDPAAAAPPIPWERPSRGWVFRYAATLASALAPYRTAAAFARGAVRPGLSFALLSFVPLAALSGIVPFTHTLLFGPNLSFGTLGDPTPDAVVLDVFRAMGIGLVFHAVRAAALAAPYVSLSRAYAVEGHEAAPVRALLYRAWLIPVSFLLLALLAWPLPAEPGLAADVLLFVPVILPTVLLFSSLFSTARMGSGIGPVMAAVVTAVAFSAFFAAEWALGTALTPLLPDPETLRQLADS